jgi:ribosomal-protein-alanine N-acetyltransferase
MMGNVPLILETPRTILRDLLQSDWPLVYALSRESSVTRYQTWFRLNGELEVQRWLDALISQTNQRRPRVSFNLALVLKENGAPIGWLGFGEPEDPAKGDMAFGYALLPSFWGKGYMTEAVEVMLNFAFESLSKESVYATCAESNQASVRVLEKAGLVIIERWQQRDEIFDIVEGHLCYRIHRSDWARMRTG